MIQSYIVSFIKRKKRIIMTKGLLCARWDDRLGVVIEGQYPSDLTKDLKDEDILSIFTTHALSESEGLLSLKVADFSIVSYYSGKTKDPTQSQYIVALVLEESDNPNSFEESLTEVSKMVIDNVGKPDFEKFLVSCFESASTMKIISNEQRYAFIFRDELRHFVLNLLREGAMTKDEIIKWVSKETKQKVSNIDELLSPLIRSNLISEIQVQESTGLPMEYIFLIRDVGIMRAPPLKIINLLKKSLSDPSLRQALMSAVEEFFKQYKITEEDTKKIAELITNANTYDIIKILRENFLRKDDLIPKLGRSFSELDADLARLAEAKIILPLVDPLQQTWIFLLSDVQALTIFPDYMIDIIEKQWREHILSDNVAIKHLELLKTEYQSTEI